MVEEELRNKIHDKVRLIYKNRKNSEVFTPGETNANYAGRVYDENELISLIDSSLDFWLTAGRYANKFEKDFAKFLGIKYCLLTNSGSSANLLAISALTSSKLGEKMLKPCDEVITTACGFPTTLNPIIQNNLTPVMVDVELGTCNIQVEKIEDAISSKTRAIFVPHTLGNPANINGITEIVEDNDLWFIENNCDALGSHYEGKYTGTFGHISTFSFYPAHHITMGEGRALVTDNPALKDIITSFRDWGRDCWCETGCDNSCGKRFSRQMGELPYGYDNKYVYSHIDYNLQITDMQAAIGIQQLQKLPLFIDARKNNFKRIYNTLKEYENYLMLPKLETNADPSWFGFPIIIRKKVPFTRNDIVSHLEDNKIATRMLFGGNIIKQPAYHKIHYYIADNLKNTDFIMNNLFWIGVYPRITEEKMNYMIKVLKEFLNLQ